MDVSQRLDLYRQSINLTISQMADMAGIPRPTLWQFLNGRNKTLRDDMAAKIHDTFPSLNIMWLMFGEGPMALEQNMKISEDSSFYKINIDASNINEEHYELYRCKIIIDN